MALLERLEKDESLSAFAGRFVPLKLVAEGNNKEWTNWKRQYEYEGKTIPILFVIRADGQQLYGKSGSLPGDALPQMLGAALEQAGRSITEQEYEFLTTQVKAAETALHKGDQFESYLQAARELSMIAKNGAVPGNLGSYAEPAVLADELAGKITERTSGQIRQLATQLVAGDENAFQYLTTLYELDLFMRDWPQVQSQLADLLPKLSRQQSLKELHKPAKQMAKARVLVVSEKARERKQAARLYSDLQKKFARADDMAILTTIQSDIERWQKAGLLSKDLEIRADSVTGKPKRRGESYRRWSDATGTFTLRARLIKVDDQTVTLQKPDGTTVDVPLEKLSDADRKYLADRE